MFRKLLLVALLAAILVGSLIGIGLDRAQTDQVAGGAKALDPTGRVTYEPSSGIEVAGGAKALDPAGRIQG